MVHPDDVGRVQALAEDALLRASNAQQIAEDALQRAAEVVAQLEDALARADNAGGSADDALQQAAAAQATGEDALGRADHAAAQSRDALARVDGIQELADRGLQEAAAARATGEDALGRADHATAQSGDALARVDGIQELADRGLQEAATAQATGEDALGRADHATAQSGDALARVDGIQELADRGLQHAATAQAKAEDALARAEHAGALGDDAAAIARLAADSASEALGPARMAAFTSWLELCPPIAGPLVSVILPTRDRPALLPRAVASLLEQHYERWELVVVDDGDTDAVGTVLADVEDERILTVDGPRRGLGAARNAGLDAATGEVVCYLDDDNVMHPRWLQAVAHLFYTREDVDVAYGVTLAEQRVPDPSDPADWWPTFWQLPWSREKLLEQNVADAGALAHRRELAEARFDEQLPTGEDWDLLIRLTAERPALAVPAVSHAYTLSIEGRMSRQADHAAGLDEIRRRHARD
jgi:hypothetical protein